MSILASRCIPWTVISALHVAQRDMACGDTRDFPPLSRVRSGLSRGKVSQPCLARPVRRPLPRSLCGGKEDAPDTAVLETTRGYAALSQHLAAWRGQPRPRIAVAHAHALCVCHALPPGTCLRMRSPRV